MSDTTRKTSEFPGISNTQGVEFLVRQDGNRRLPITVLEQRILQMLLNNPGPPGPMGPQGPEGEQGPEGDVGPVGPPGSTGPTGPQGVPGNQGPQGVPGTPGATGPAGPQGPTGGLGPQGNQGPIGPTGPIGPEGPQGPAGVGIVLKGTVPTVNDLPADPQQGDAWVVEATGDLWSWNGTAWINLGPIQGPPGDPGIQGPPGPAGIPGADGATGPMGPAGSQGPIGLTGPQGLPGAKGDTGATGPAGSPGATGPAGPPGPPGADGDDGAPGATGPQGIQGIQGIPGETGPAGPAGPPGNADDRVLRAGDTMTGTLRLPAGTVVAPALSLNAVGTGLSAPDALTMVFSLNTAERLRLTVNALIPNVPISAPIGAVDVPALNFQGETNSGIYLADDGVIGISTIGVERMRISAMSIVSTVAIQLPGNATAPLHAVPKQQLDAALADLPPPGMSQEDADARFVLKAGDTMTGALLLPSGTAALPSYSFSGDTDTGIFRAGTNTLGFAAGGGQRMSLGTVDHVLTGRRLTMQEETPTHGVVLRLNAGVGPFSSQLEFLRNGTPRWWVHMPNGAADVGDGSNAGGDFFIRRWSDAGTSLGDVMTINRATGSTRFGTNGSLSAPTIALGGPNTGINGNGANTEFIQNGGVRVSIGTNLLTVNVPLSVAHNNSAGNVIQQSGAGTALRVTNLGSGHSLLVEDSSHPDSTPFVIDNAGLVGIGTPAPRSILDIVDTGAIVIPTGTTAQQPATPNAGMLRFNTTLTVFEGHDGTAWVPLTGGVQQLVLALQDALDQIDALRVRITEVEAAARR